MKTRSAQPLGPLMIDIEGHVLTALDNERLTHPLVGGVILFTRNYRDRQQLTELCAEIHALRTPQLLIAIDHEGGRVQRCRDDFSLIPAMRKLGTLWDTDATGACEAAICLLLNCVNAALISHSPPCLILIGGEAGLLATAPSIAILRR